MDYLSVANISCYDMFVCRSMGHVNAHVGACGALETEDVEPEGRVEEEAETATTAQPHATFDDVKEAGHERR